MTPPDPRQWLPEASAWSPMNAHRIVRVSGPDAAGLLQGQLSSDISALDGNPAQLSSFNSPKGRVLAVLRVFKRGDDFWLVLDEPVANAFVERLKMFVLRSKVSIDAEPGIGGQVMAGIDLRERIAALPAPGEAVVQGERVLLGMPGPVPRVEIAGPVSSLEDPGLIAAGDGDLARWDILARIPRISDANRDRYVAQHIGLEELGAISFNKGCYTGQEIIARLKYRGKVRKNTAIFLGKNAGSGDPVTDENEKSAGEVINTAPAGDGQLLLAVVNLDDRDRPLFVNGNPLQRV